MVLVASIFMALLGFGLIAMSLGSLIDERKRIKSLINVEYNTPRGPDLAPVRTVEERLKENAAGAKSVDNSIDNDSAALDFKDKHDMIKFSYKDEIVKSIAEQPDIKESIKEKEKRGSGSDVNNMYYHMRDKVSGPLTVDILVEEAKVIRDTVNKEKNAENKDINYFINRKESTDEKIVPARGVLNLVYYIEFLRYTADTMLNGIGKNPELFVESAGKKGINPEDYVTKLKLVVGYMDESFDTLNSAYTEVLRSVGTKVDVIKELLAKDPKTFLADK